MAHYDSLYEEVTKEEIEKEIKNNSDYILKLKNKEEKIKADILIVSEESKEVLKYYLLQVKCTLTKASVKHVNLENHLKRHISGKKVYRNNLI